MVEVQISRIQVTCVYCGRLLHEPVDWISLNPVCSDCAASRPLLAVGRRVASRAAGASSRPGSKIDTQQPIQDVAPIGARRAVSGGPGVAADDELFLERLRSGEDAAFEQLVRLHAGRLHRIARSLVGNEEVARDCVQQAFLSAFRSIGRFEGRSSLSTWLHRIVTNAALMTLRRDRRPVTEDYLDSGPLDRFELRCKTSPRAERAGLHRPGGDASC